MSVKYNHVRASDHRKEAELQNPPRVSLGRCIRSCSQTCPVAVGTAYLELSMAQLLHQTPAQLEAAISQIATYREADYVVRSVGYPYNAQYEILVNL
ncbi:hypothetical protein ACHAQJ_009143 [Trichoderma viride]